MCGIAGIVSEQAFDQLELTSMTMALSHRGPDAQNTFFNDTSTVGLGHTRLSIIDLSCEANQPMISDDGRFVIVFNGEIYNYRSLRRDLEKLDTSLKFQTNSDTEVILHGFAHWGENIAAKLQGMFAFAIYDQRKNKLFFCRDRIGKKPLYYFRDKDRFVFASEIKALVKSPAIKANLSVNYEALYTFLHIGYIPEPHSIYTSIHKFPAGHFAFVEDDFSLHPKAFWNVVNDHSANKQWTDREAKDQLNSVLSNAIQDRLVSDVPLGSFLSGGTDSSLITAIASRLKSDKLKTFSIGFSESKFNEGEYAKRVASYLHTEHHAYTLSESEAVNILEAYLQHFDEPFADTSAIPTMLVSKLARDHVTVALAGDGGDELFLGYGSYDWATRLASGWVKALQSPLSFAFRNSRNDRLKRISFLLEKVKEDQKRSHIFSQEQYLFSRKEIIHKLMLSSKDPFGMLEYNDPISTDLSESEKQALFDIQFYLKDDLLVKVDRASMFYGLECRNPFLDYNVIALAHKLPVHMKKRGKEHKWILKEMLKEYLPDDLIYRPKWGFSIPLAKWMKNELAYMIEKYLSRESVEEIGIVKYPYIHELKNAFAKGDNFLYNRLWVLIVAHKWLYENTR